MPVNRVAALIELFRPQGDRRVDPQVGRAGGGIGLAGWNMFRFATLATPRKFQIQHVRTDDQARADGSHDRFNGEIAPSDVMPYE
jgi:hypothetical protein